MCIRDSSLCDESLIINLSHDPMCDDGILLLKGNDILRIQYNIGIDQYETAGGYRGLHRTTQDTIDPEMTA